MLNSVDIYNGIAERYKGKIQILQLVCTQVDLGNMMAEMILTFILK